MGLPYPGWKPRQHPRAPVPVRAERVLDIPIPVPCDVVFFASVRQNDPALNPTLTDCTALSALSDEDRFLVTYNNFAQYGSIAGSLVFEENLDEDVP
jgi:hypothetical protein